MKKTVALMRVSTQEQELASQRQAIEDYCKANRIVIDEWIEEQGVSGYKNKLSDRVAIQQIENMALNEEIDTLIIFNLDRIGRTLEGNIFMATMSECNVKVISVTEGVLNGDDMNSELLTSIKFAIAKIESKKISARSIAGKRAINEKGLFAGGGVPLGYKIINQQAVIVAEEAEIVREVFRLYIEKGTSITRKELNEKGLYKRGREWSKSMVHDLLTDSVYIGLRRYNYHKKKTSSPTDQRRYKNKETMLLQPYNEQLRIVDDITFYKAQELLKSRKSAAKGETTSKTNKTNVLLEGLMYHVCEDGEIRKLHIDWKTDKYGNKIQSFRCAHCRNVGGSNRKTYGGKKLTPIIEQAILKELESMKVSNIEERVAAATNSEIQALNKQWEANKTAVDKKITALSNAKLELEKIFSGESTMDMGVVNNMVLRLEKEVQELKSGIKDIPRQLDEMKKKNMVVQNLVNQYKNFSHVYHKAELLEKKRLLQEVVEKIIMHENDKIEIVLYSVC